MRRCRCRRRRGRLSRFYPWFSLTLVDAGNAPASQQNAMIIGRVGRDRGMSKIVGFYKPAPNGTCDTNRRGSPLSGSSNRSSRATNSKGCEKSSYARCTTVRVEIVAQISPVRANSYARATGASCRFSDAACNSRTDLPATKRHAASPFDQRFRVGHVGAFVRLQSSAILVDMRPAYQRKRQVPVDAHRRSISRPLRQGRAVPGIRRF